MPDVPIDGMYCMACGHPWNAHGRIEDICREPKPPTCCGCDRYFDLSPGFNAHDWQARIRELEAALNAYAKLCESWQQWHDLGRMGPGTIPSMVLPAYREAFRNPLCNLPFLVLKGDDDTCAAAIEKVRKDHHVTP